MSKPSPRKRKRKTTSRPSSLLKELHYHTEKASDVSRNLAFSGLALVWLLKVGSDISALGVLKFALASYILSLSFDFFQYAIASLTLQIYKSSGKISKCIIGIFFWGKLFCVFLGYVLIVMKMFELLFPDLPKSQC